ncbi:MAG: 5-(carboxyamino)imidazole ribonucleotide mutase [Hyphomicrobiaceae bacterium]|nr:5-(carboxyamino)imidazole ribonucleotide mutase [Hyphomicrobiaceae bacterium]
MGHAEREAKPVVGIIMGSQTDWTTMHHAADVLAELGVPFETRIVSAHRTPDRLYEYAKSAKARGIKVIVAGAGGAAHLPGMTASLTTLPVLGVPVHTQALSGVDSLYSIVQMPAGVPVGTLAIGRAGATNAGLFAASILALADAGLAGRLEAWRAAKTAAIAQEPRTEPKVDPAVVGGPVGIGHAGGIPTRGGS